MLRLLGRRGVRAVPWSAHLSSSHQTRNMRAPYSVPLGSEIIVRRFSSREFEPRVYCTNLHDYDVSIPDVTNDTLQTTIAEKLGIGYHSKATDADAAEVAAGCTGIIYGQPGIGIVPFIVRHEREARWVFFFVHSMSPLTYLSTRVSARPVLGGVRTITLTTLDLQPLPYQGRTKLSRHHRWAPITRFEVASGISLWRSQHSWYQLLCYAQCCRDV